MNSRELWLAAAAAAPLLAYFLGRFSRWAGLAAGAGLFAAAAFMLRGQAPAGPFAVLALWSAAALAYAFRLSGAAWQTPDRGSLRASEEALLTLEKELAEVKAASRQAASGEKRSLAIYAAVKLLSETVDPQAAGRQLGKYLADYFSTEAVALYLEGEQGQAELFAQGASATALPGHGDLAARAQGLTGPVESDGLVLAPMFAGEGQPLGFLVLKRQAAGDAEAAGRFAAEVSFAVRRVQLFRQVERLSLTDGLTGLWRRSALDEKIADELRRSAAFKTSTGLMIVDIDHFKRLNDNYGHQFGDVVLRRVAQLLREGVYETDFVGRYGGEEFGIVLPRADAAGLLRKAETIRSRIEAESFQQGLDRVRLTVSIGIAHSPRDAQSPGELVAKADAALYAAKSGGRNRVVDAGGGRI